MASKNKTTGPGFELRTEEEVGGEIFIRIIPKRTSKRPRIELVHGKLHSLMVQLYSPS